MASLYFMSHFIPTVTNPLLGKVVLRHNSNSPTQLAPTEMTKPPRRCCVQKVEAASVQLPLPRCRVTGPQATSTPGSPGGKGRGGPAPLVAGAVLLHQPLPREASGRVWSGTTSKQLPRTPYQGGVEPPCLPGCIRPSVLPEAPLEPGIPELAVRWAIQALPAASLLPWLLQTF